MRNGHTLVLLLTCDRGVRGPWQTFYMCSAWRRAADVCSCSRSSERQHADAAATSQTCVRAIEGKQKLFVLSWRGSSQRVSHSVRFKMQQQRLKSELRLPPSHPNAFLLTFWLHKTDLRPSFICPPHQQVAINETFRLTFLYSYVVREMVQWKWI